MQKHRIGLLKSEFTFLVDGARWIVEIGAPDVDGDCEILFFTAGRLVSNASAKVPASDAAARAILEAFFETKL